jgi:S1-C subfamily serine protease
MEFRGARTFASRSSLAAPIRSRVFDVGWVKSIGERVKGSVNSDLARYGVDNSTGFFSDTGSSENGPRRLLLAALREGRDRHISQVPQSETFFEEVKSREVHEWVTDCPKILAPIEPFEDLAALTRVAHSSAVWIESWIGRRRTLTAGLVIGADQVLTCRHPLGEADTILVTDSTGTTHSAAVQSLCEGADLVVLGVEGLGGAPAAIDTRIESPDEPLDTRVFGLMKERGATRVAGPVMGEVTARSRFLDVPDFLARAHKKTPVDEILFERSAGYPGMPVFASNGQVVGIQTDASSARPDDSTGCYRRYVVPAKTITQFLSNPKTPIDHGLAFEQVLAGAESAEVGDRPDDFLGTLINVDSDHLYMQPKHWKEGKESQAEVTDLWPVGVTWPIKVEEASAGTLTFGHDLRVVVRRVELTAAHRWDELSSIADPEGELPRGTRGTVSNPSAGGVLGEGSAVRAPTETGSATSGEGSSGLLG